MYFLLIIIIIIIIIIWFLTSKEKETHIHPKPIHDQKTGKVKFKGSLNHEKYHLVLRSFGENSKEIFTIVDTVKTDGSIRKITLNTHSNTPVESFNLLIVGNSTLSVNGIAFTNTSFRKYFFSDIANIFRSNPDVRSDLISIPGLHFPSLPPNVLAFTNGTNTTNGTKLFDYNVNDSLTFISLIDEKVELKVELGDNFELSHVFTLAEEDVTFLICKDNFPGLNKIKESTPKIFRVVDVTSDDINLEFNMFINDPIISNQ